MLDRSIYDAMGRKGIIEYNETHRFSHPMYDYIHEAESLISHNEYESPFWIARLILESLPELPIDDSDGTTSYVESMCVEVIDQILDKCKNEQIKIQIFNWIMDSLKNNTLGDYSDGVEGLLDEYFQDNSIVNTRLEMLNAKIELLKEDKGGSCYSEYKMVYCLKDKIALLYQLEKDEKAEKTIRQNIC